MDEILDEILYGKFYEIETYHWWFSARREIIFDFIQKNKIIKPDSNILDYGCGTGGIIDILKKNYINVYGTDFSEVALNFCRKRNFDNIFSLESIFQKEFHNYFDLITILDVIEHIANDTEILEKLKLLLKKDGYILITVPAYQFLFGPYDILTQHKRRYIKKSLIKIVKKAEYDIVKISYFNIFLSPLMILSRILSSFTGWNKDTNIPNKILNKILYNIFKIEKYFLRYISFPFGISIICLAKKK